MTIRRLPTVSMFALLAAAARGETALFLCGHPAKADLRRRRDRAGAHRCATHWGHEGCLRLPCRCRPRSLPARQEARLLPPRTPAAAGPGGFGSRNGAKPQGRRG